MSLRTKIHFCDSTCNPTMGYEGCELWSPQRRSCYAGLLHVRFGGATPGYAPTFEEITLFPGRMAKAARWPNLAGQRRFDKHWLSVLPRLIFISDMSDSLSLSVPFAYLEQEIIANVTSSLGRRHHWLWLTKRPERMAGFSAWLAGCGPAWPENLWAGTSITTQGTTGRIKSLMQVGTDRTIRFLSVVPQVELLDICPWLPALDWVIQGGESGRNARPFDLAWARAMLRQCRAGGVPYFLQQLGSAVYDGGCRQKYEHSLAGDWSEWPKALRVREVPEVPKKGR